MGSYLVDRLIYEGWDVTVLDNLQRGTRAHLKESMYYIDFKQVDLKSIEKAQESIDECDVCFHLASHLGGINYIYQSEYLVADNFVINFNVFDACIRSGVKKIVFPSSACAYPTWVQSRENHPLMTEEMAMDPGAYPESMYGWAKLMGELMLKALRKEYGIKVGLLRPFNIYGPREEFDVEKGHVIPAFIVKALRRDDPFFIWGTGLQERAFIYVTDMVDAFMLAYEKSDDATPINVGDPQRYTMFELAKMVTDVAGYAPKFKTQPDKPEGVFSRAPDITRAREVLGWEPKVSMEDGILRTWDWAQQNVSV